MIDRQLQNQLRKQVKRLLDELAQEPRTKTTNDLRRGACMMLAALNAALREGEKTDKRVYPVDVSD